MADYIGVYLVDLPYGIRGLVRKNEDGSYTILINARLNVETQLTAYDHEMKHINNGDYDICIDVGKIENERHVG